MGPGISGCEGGCGFSLHGPVASCLLEPIPLGNSPVIIYGPFGDEKEVKSSDEKPMPMSNTACQTEKLLFVDHFST